MQAILLKCRPGAQFHLGQVGIDADTALNTSATHIPSDTLFSALVNLVALCETEATVEAFVAAFAKGDVRISSAFHCLEEPLFDEADALIETQRTFFLPKPAHYGRYPVSGDPKVWRDIRYISRGVWESGALPNQWHENRFVVLQGIFLATRSELSNGALVGQKALQIFQEQLLPRVDARTPGAENSHFYSANTQIADNTDLTDANGNPLTPHLQVHYYFLLDQIPGFGETLAGQALATALALLPQAGVGGERSVGCGRFEGMEVLPFPSFKTRTAMATVSLCSPANANELEAFEAYETVLRGGRQTAGDGPLQLLRMIAEGALSFDGSIQGHIHDLRTPTAPSTAKPYWRSGKPFWLPVAC